MSAIDPIDFILIYGQIVSDNFPGWIKEGVVLNRAANLLCV